MTPTEKTWRNLFLAFFLLVALLKLMAAGALALYSDEAFYWQCAQRLSFAYTDLPPMTAWWVWLGTALLGDTTTGVRLLFWLAGLALPFCLWALARPLFGAVRAWQTAILALALPALGVQGALAIPDTPLLLFTALFLLGFERGARTDATRYWLLAGAAGAMGLATHYRFILTPAAAGLYLLAFSHGRSLLRRKGPWLTAAVAALGALPALIFNLRRDMEPLRYFLPGRHAAGFRLDELGEHLTEQAIAASPLLYLALWAALIWLVRRALRGEARAALFACFAILPIGVFLIASPFKASGLQTMHWPLAGYLPLLVWLPEGLAEFIGKSKARWRRLAAWTAPTFGALLLAVTLLELATGWLQLHDVRRPFLGWQEAAARTESLLPRFAQPDGGRPIVVADNYKLGANLEFQFGDRARIVILDHSKNYEHGRQRQFDRWRIGEAALKELAGDRVLLAVQWSETVSHAKDNWVKHLDWLFSAMAPIDELTVDKGKRPVRIDFYDAIVREK